MKTKINLTYYWFLSVVTVILLWSGCANPTSPTGGPEDRTAPIILKAEPEMFTVNFNAKHVRIWFDEFIQIKDLQSQLIISPPMEKDPEFQLKGKSLIIEFKSPLKENTTYRVFMGDAISDITENNPVKSFAYVFATGPLIDSLTVSGQVLNAQNLEAEEDIAVMLYRDNNDTIPFDSLPYFVRPYYITKADEEGGFSLNNLAMDEYLIFALKDANRNFLYDQPDELIAFSDSLIVPWYDKSKHLKKELIADTLLLENDSILADTMNSEIIINPSDSNRILFPADTSLLLADSSKFVAKQSQKLPDLDLWLFDEIDSLQILKEASQLKKSHLQFVLKHPSDKSGVYLLYYEPILPEIKQRQSRNGDTIDVWFQQDTLLESLTFVVFDDQLVLDTIDFLMPEPAGLSRSPMKVSLKNNVIKENEPLIMSFDYPVEEATLDSLLLVEGMDTLKTDFNFIDEYHLEAAFMYPWSVDSYYKILGPDSCITNIAGQLNDSINIAFQIKALSDFGNLILNMTIADSLNNYQVQLISNEKIFSVRNLMSSGQLRFNHLVPGEYSLKLIIDENKNKRWDAGNYIYGIQPEKVVKYPKSVNIRENWDIEEDWDIQNKK